VVAVVGLGIMSVTLVVRVIRLRLSFLGDMDFRGPGDVDIEGEWAMYDESFFRLATMASIHETLFLHA
jgi:hypothetical protein